MDADAPKMADLSTSIMHVKDSSPEARGSAKRTRIEGNHALSTPVRFLILSDTHGVELPLSLPPCDVLLHCGDLTEDGSPESISFALRSLGKVEAKLKLVIAGNHEISLDKAYWLSQGGDEADVKRSQALVGPKGEAARHGVTFLSEGTHTFNLPCGATFRIYASPYTPGFATSAFQYPSSNDRFNHPDITPSWAKNVGTKKSIIPEDVDIVMTHGPPKYILDDTDNGDSVGCEHLRNAIARVQPRLHCFGHVHLPEKGWKYEAHRLQYRTPMKLSGGDSEPITNVIKDWVGSNQARKKGFRCLSPGAAEQLRENKRQTLCVNAAMEGGQGILEHPPWLVTLDLPAPKPQGLYIPTIPTNITPIMSLSSSLVPYRPSPVNTMTLQQQSSTLISSRLFTQQAGMAIATELLYRILFDIVNRLLSSLQRLAAQSMDEASTWLQRKLQERRDARTLNSSDGLKIVQEVGRLAEQQGFITCPLTGRAMPDANLRGTGGPRGPPKWVRGVLEGIDEGRILERDVWINTHGD
ncbi:ser thr protein phosphatase family protein [Curvularia clavata]|uniref:Ser thr protein phosphatase family protein n=1 Tax=Curvularia clavata TaxID=95742 RepID=A0A9Q8ZFH8_CURCL|nr:ser thr protein phosphatase family protein [Curvularia clavata]